MGAATAFEEFVKAEQEWHAELEREFPGVWPGELRPTRRAMGEPGTPLREKYEAFGRAADAWEREREREGVIVTRQMGINAVESRKPMTPPYTLDALERAIENGAIDALTGQIYIKIDSRVLRWLIADSRSLYAIAAPEVRTIRQQPIPTVLDAEDRSGECA